MKNLNLKAFGGLFPLFIIMLGLLLFSAGTFYYWQAWLFLTVFFLSALVITLYLMIKDPELLNRRTKGGPVSEKETSQKNKQPCAKSTGYLEESQMLHFNTLIPDILFNDFPVTFLTNCGDIVTV